MTIKNKLKKQYNLVSDSFSNNQINYNKKSNEEYYKFINTLNIDNKKVLDLGCGDGTEVSYFSKKGANVTGIDSSEELIEIAKQKNINAIVGDFENLPFKDKSIDYIFSKYALQTLNGLDKMYSEVHRTLKKNGIFYFLVVHPFRQFLEKKDSSANYFKRTIISSKIFGGTLVFEEPTHTMKDYLNRSTLEKFELIIHNEGEDFVSAERIGNQTYPTYLIIGLKKK